MSKFKPGDVVGACFDAGIYYGTVIDPCEKLDPPPAEPLSEFSAQEGYTWVRFPIDSWKKFFRGVIWQPQNALLVLEWTKPVGERRIPTLRALASGPLGRRPDRAGSARDRADGASEHFVARVAPAAAIREHRWQRGQRLPTTTGRT
jgi:hypothetical protein